MTSQPPAGPYPPAPQPGQPIGGLAPGAGLLKLTIQGSIMTSSLIAPTVLLDGTMVASKYGENVYQVPAGRHHVELYAQWMRRYGQAAIDVDVPLAGQLDVFYAAPLHQFTTGNIGLVKQRRKGAGFFIGLMVFVVVLVVAAIAVAFLN